MSLTKAIPSLAGLVADAETARLPQKLYFYSRWTKNYARGGTEGVLMRSCFTPVMNSKGVVSRVLRTQVCARVRGRACFV